MASVSNSHSVWESHFTPQQREQMIHDDIFAGESVLGFLIGLFVMGALGLLLSVALITLF